MTIKVEILNPKAKKLLNDLADLNLISISEVKEDTFMEVVRRIRSKSKENKLPLSEITKEVEKVRSRRYADYLFPSHNLHS
jgi:hypothetical protein